VRAFGKLGERIIRQPSGARQSLHRHSEWRVVLFLAGVTEEASFGDLGSFRRGAFVVRPPFYAHSDQTVGADDARYVRLRLTPRAARAYFARHGWRVLRGDAKLDGLDLARRVSAEAGGDELLALVDGEAYAARPPASPMRHLAVRLGNGPQVLERVADEMGLRPYQLTRLFTRAFGVSPREYARQARLQRTLAMLSEGVDTLAGVAQAVGFHDQSHLNRELMRETGLTPRGFASAFG